MHTVAIVGAGLSALHIAVALARRGHAVTVFTGAGSNRDGGTPSSPHIVFDRARAREHAIGLGGGYIHAPPQIEGLSFRSEGVKPGSQVRWSGRFKGPATATDRLLAIAEATHALAAAGGRIEDACVDLPGLEALAHDRDLVLVGAGRDAFPGLFARDPSRSSFRTPQRVVSTLCVETMPQPPDHLGHTVECTILPGLGEYFVVPMLGSEGTCQAVSLEAVPGGPFDVLDKSRNADELLDSLRCLARVHLPWEYERLEATGVAATRPTLAAMWTPVVRDPVRRFASGAAVLGVGDAVVSNDPISGQGANSAILGAAVYAERIHRHAGPFDEEWMRATFARYWSVLRPATHWSNLLLARRPPHLHRLFEAAARSPDLADYVAEGFADPARLAPYVHHPGAVEELIAATLGVPQPNGASP
ncbi:hypothetical protein OG216_46115 (plasmid) [Streptomycetaceae bacterium NBC_01309]